MARKEQERQLRLFGVGDLGPPDEEGGGAVPEGSDDERWDAVYRHLGRILAEEGFGAYLGRRRRQDEGQTTGD